MNAISDLHPLRVSQLSSSFRRDCETFRKSAHNQVARVHRDDGAELVLEARETSLPIWAGMSFDELQAMIAKKGRDDYEVQMFVKFWDGPRQIFKFDPALADMLAKTEVGDVPWDSLHFPYEHFYLHFGCVLDTVLDPGSGRLFKAEGAYVRVQGGPSFIEGFLPGAIHISIATRLIHPNYGQVMQGMGKAFSLKEPTYNITISGERNETVAQTLARGREANLEAARKLDRGSLQSAIELAAHYNVDPIGATAAASLQLEEKKYLRGEAITTEALGLVFNCMAYLSSTPPDTEPEYPPEAPKPLIEKIDKASTPNKKRILTNNMESLGFTKIRFVRDPSPHEASIPTGKTVRTHWRRGHWRSQPCGSGMVKRMLIWIRPCIVKPDKEKESSPAPGRIYKVAEENEPDSPSPEL